MLLLSYEYDNRRGSEYITDPYTAYYSASMGPVPTATGTNMTNWIHNNSALRKFDLADRDQNIVKARLNWTGIRGLDAGLTVQYNGITYPDTAYGRNGSNDQTTVSLNLELRARGRVGSVWLLHVAERQAAPGRPAGERLRDGNDLLFLQQRRGQYHRHGARGRHARGQHRRHAGELAAGLHHARRALPALSHEPGLDQYAELDQPDLRHRRALRLRQARFNVNYTYTNGRTKTSYEYNADALGFSPAQLALIGAGMPDSVFIQSIVDAGVLVPITSALAVRFYYRYENGRISDWHYDGVQQNPVPSR